MEIKFDTITCTDVNIKYLALSYSKTSKNFNNEAKKDIKHWEKSVHLLDRAIEILSNSSIETFPRDKYGYFEYSNEIKEVFPESSKDSSDIRYAVGSAIKYAFRKTESPKSMSKDEIVVACNDYLEYLGKKITECQDKLEKTLSDDEWLLDLNFGKCYRLWIMGAAAKSAFEILSDKKNHSFRFKINNVIHNAENEYRCDMESEEFEEIDEGELEWQS